MEVAVRTVGRRCPRPEADGSVEVRPGPWRLLAIAAGHGCCADHADRCRLLLTGTRVVLRALPDVFPWVRHLQASELEEFAREVFAALTDAAELDADTNVNEVVAGWRATARSKADKSQYSVSVACGGRDGRAERPEWT
jgi:hypothetical protein